MFSVLYIYKKVSSSKEERKLVCFSFHILNVFQQRNVLFTVFIKAGWQLRRIMTPILISVSLNNLPFCLLLSIFIWQDEYVIDLESIRVLPLGASQKPYRKTSMIMERDLDKLSDVLQQPWVWIVLFNQWQWFFSVTCLQRSVSAICNQVLSGL